MDEGIQIWIRGNLLTIRIYGYEVDVAAVAADGRGVGEAHTATKPEGVVLTGPMLFKAIQELNKGA